MTLSLVLVLVLVLVLSLSSSVCDAYNQRIAIARTVTTVYGHANNDDAGNNVNTEMGKLRKTVRKGGVTGVGVLLGLLSKNSKAVASSSKIQVQQLPYDYNALEPYISTKTMQFHHDKHYAKYVATTNQLIENTDLAGSDLITIMQKSYNTNQGLFNAAAQSLNHFFYWNCMKPNGGGDIPPKLKRAIDKSFGSVDEFRKQLAAAGNGIFGSGWAWLVQTKAGDLEIVKTSGAENPIVFNKTPILTIDVWEHAYYLDYQNMRSSYIDAFLDKLVNWDFVEKQMRA